MILSYHNTFTVIISNLNENKIKNIFADKSVIRYNKLIVNNLKYQSFKNKDHQNKYFYYFAKNKHL